MAVQPAAVAGASMVPIPLWLALAEAAGGASEGGRGPLAGVWPKGGGLGVTPVGSTSAKLQQIAEGACDGATPAACATFSEVRAPSLPGAAGCERRVLFEFSLGGNESPQEGNAMSGRVAENLSLGRIGPDGGAGVSRSGAAPGTLERLDLGNEENVEGRLGEDLLRYTDEAA